MKRNVSKRRQSFGVTEADVFITNVADDALAVAAIAGRGAGVTDPGYKTGFRVFIENIEYAFARRTSRLHQLIQLM